MTGLFHMPKVLLGFHFICVLRKKQGACTGPFDPFGEGLCKGVMYV